MLVHAFAIYASPLNLKDDATSSGDPAQRSSSLFSYGYGSGSRVHFEQGVEVGGFVPFSSNKAGISYKGGFNFAVDLGASIEVGSGNSNRSGSLSFTFLYSLFNMKQSYLDYTQNNHTDNIWLTAVGVPVSYTSLSNTDRGGNFWQIGANLLSVTDANAMGDRMTKNFSSFYVEPFVAFGWVRPFELFRNGNFQGEGDICFGPFVSYAATNLSTVSGITLNGLRFGIKYSYVFH
jgi:hypothetical protein